LNGRANADRVKHANLFRIALASVPGGGARIPIVAADNTRASIFFTVTRLPSGLAWSGKFRRLIHHGKDTKMEKSKDIREAVEAELDFDPLVDPSEITVKNINGQVALNGSVPSYPQYLQAAAAARRVAGVTDVHNHLEVVLPDGDYRDDAMLTTAANNALAVNVTAPNGVEATVRDGNLTLTGTVRFGSQRAAAESAVAGLIGVRNIDNEVLVWDDADPVDVTLLVQDALDRYALIPDGSDVTVDTSGNTVTLAGHVRTWAEHDAVVGATWMATGVFDVRDDIYVTG
jgi:osmotically-inducible protein OsmY